MVMRQSFLLVAAGLSIGIPGALMSTRILDSLLFGLTPADVPVLVGAVLLLTLVSAAAAYIPARRASQVDPLVALRSGG